MNSNVNKKVLLRERKRHTACHVASTRCAALSPVGGGGGGRGGLPTLALAGGGGVPTLDWGVPTLAGGWCLPWTAGGYLPWPGGKGTYPGWGVPTLDWGGGVLILAGSTYLGLGKGYIWWPGGTYPGWGGESYPGWGYLPWMGWYLPWPHISWKVGTSSAGR